ncbi:hypothetical protein [Methylobacterium platani]|uniref:Uncharacterized protein n=2 Tax=Methylobacterium platani TaxID=427683 RepID=A0A179SEK3_9HYPH|nr:hypothetical protein [Methylobacterium platani]KMO21415.1 hypothetical protein SQ03_03440 [Methylobacterium platani JCM 14648]OAS26306.1 hypothetical protein A5481_06215 [Methylobacterium platani]
MSNMTPQKFQQLRQKAGDRRRLSATQLQEALRVGGLDLEMLATLLSTRVERVRSWLSGQEDIPVYLDVLLATLRVPGGAREAWTLLHEAEAIPTDQQDRFKAWARRDV